MHVEWDLGKRAQSAHDGRSNRDVGDEMAVHDVNMNPVGASFHDRADFLAELGEISGQNRRGDDKRCHLIRPFIYLIQVEDAARLTRLCSSKLSGLFRGAAP